MTQLQKATQEYISRQDRVTHPNGTFDSGGRWYPSEAEEHDCCGSIRNPSRAWPLSLNKHCRSIKHVAALYGVEAKELRRAVKAARTLTLQPAAAMA